MDDEFKIGADRPSRGPQRVQSAAVKTDRLAEINDLPDGNYLFSFGFPGSGKTTFQWMLMNYIINEGPFLTTVKVPVRKNGEDWNGRQLINEWKDQWIEGRFPDPTKTGDLAISEISANVKTTQGKKLEMDFSFLEVSGEELRSVLPKQDGKPPQLSKLISAYLENPRLKFVVALMINPEDEQNDKLFASFFSYVDARYPGLKDRMSLLVIISKPHLAHQRLIEYGSIDGRRAFDQFDGAAIMAFLARFCPETYQKWESWPDHNKTMLAQLHLGNVEQNGLEMILTDPEYDDIQSIFLWLFEQFTGTRPGPTFWQKLRGHVDWE